MMRRPPTRREAAKALHELELLFLPLRKEYQQEPLPAPKAAPSIVRRKAAKPARGEVA